MMGPAEFGILKKFTLSVFGTQRELTCECGWNQDFLFGNVVGLEEVVIAAFSHADKVHGNWGLVNPE